MTILGKKQMSEEDIKLNYITPVILKGWKGHITMETKITDGRINIRGNIVARSKPIREEHQKIYHIHSCVEKGCHAEQTNQKKDHRKQEER